MNLFKALAVKDIEAATKAIPLIDVGPAFRSEPGAIETVALEMRRACESVGFFYLAGHGVPLAVIESMQRHSTVHKATRPNFNESFFISHDRGADHPDVAAGTALRGRNQWPEGHERMRAAMVMYFKTLERLG